MNESVVIALVSITALLGTAMRLTRKYVMKHMKNYSISFYRCNYKWNNDDNSCFIFWRRTSTANRS